MAKIKVLGDSFTITSAVPAETLNKLQKFYPDALVLRSQKTDKITFAITTAPTSAALSDCGINFNSVSEDGYPYATFTLPTGIKTAEEKKAFIRNEIGTVYSRLTKLEDCINECAIAQLAELEAKFDAGIEIVD
jgi:hypothetical protein